MFDWNDLRFFLELQRSGRLLTAARRLHTTHATEARQIEAIEKSLGTALFVQPAGAFTCAGRFTARGVPPMVSISFVIAMPL